MIKAKDLIRKYNIRFSKSLGQNFLIDEAVIRNIAAAAGVGKGNLLVEIGPGIGTMTVELASKAGKVIAIEIDSRLIPALTDNLKEFSNVVVQNFDIMKVDIREIISTEISGCMYDSVKVVSNLPYYITTPVIMKLLEEKTGIDMMVLMVQKEVAVRMTASPGSKEYGALSVAVQYYSLPEIVFHVPRHCFIPQPDVESTVIRLNVYKSPPVKVTDENVFFKVVRASFGQRRKMLVNALSNSGYFIETKEQIAKILENSKIGVKQRGETLTIMQFAELANSFSVNNI